MAGQTPRDSGCADADQSPGNARQPPATTAGADRRVAHPGSDRQAPGRPSPVSSRWSTRRTKSSTGPGAASGSAANCGTGWGSRWSASSDSRRKRGATSTSTSAPGISSRCAAASSRCPSGSTTSPVRPSNDFIYRALATRTLSPGRAIGGMAHGETDRAAAHLRHRRSSMVATCRPPICCSLTMTRGGDSFGTDRRWPRHGATVRRRRAPAARAAQHGVRRQRGLVVELPNGLYGYRGRSVFGYEFFEQVYVSGDRLPRWRGRGGAWPDRPASRRSG